VSPVWWATSRAVWPRRAQPAPSELKARIGELPADSSIVVYCAGGYRSAAAASLLRRAGLSRIADLVGGLGAWRAAERPS
jgi:hydroxyacylglutathione hydrolase